MNFLISILYAPIVFYSIRNFDIKSVSLFIFVISICWLIVVYKKGYKESVFPLIYIVISILAFLLNDVTVLKILPALLSALLSLFILYTYITKNSFIFIFLEKVGKSVPKEEKEYIQRSTLFWFFSSIINLLIHIFILYLGNMEYWNIYSSIGWYIVFISAGLIQFVHKKIYFDRSI